jgi:hypothetical protein
MADTAASSTTSTASQQPAPSTSNPNQPNQNVPQPKPAEPTKEQIRRHKLKIDGQEQEFDEPEVIRRAQLYTAADRRFKEGAALRKQSEEFVNKLRTNFTELLDDPRLGLNEDQKREMFEKWYRTKYIEPQTLTPEQKKLREQEAELKRYRDEKAAEEKRQQEQQEQELENYHRGNYQKTILEALDTEGLPRTEFTGRRMVDLMAKNVQLGFDLSAKQIAQLVREDYLKEIKVVLGATDGDTMLKLMGDDIANKLRKADLARLRAGIPNVPKPVIETPQAGQQEKKNGKFISMDELKRQIDERVKSLSQK